MTYVLHSLQLQGRRLILTRSEHDTAVAYACNPSTWEVEAEGL
jgi:hypothetical protein